MQNWNLAVFVRDTKQMRSAIFIAYYNNKPMDTLKGVVDRHASAEVRAYCLYIHYFCSMSFIKLSAQFHKSPTTISEWVSNYEAGKGFTRKETDDVNAKFSTEMKEWVVSLYRRNPTLYLKEAKTEFIKMYEYFSQIIS
jgi:hypothetical protein